jgi:leucyl-tRNA synthetase
MGATYLALAPQHPLVQAAAAEDTQLHAFCQQISTSTVAEADMATMEKLGMDTGLRAQHPLTDEPLPIWVANFVLMGYGSGAVMSVPAHDQRDWEFASKYALPIVQVVSETTDAPADLSTSAYLQRGPLMQSGQFDGLDYDDAFDAIIGELESKGLGHRSVNFRLRDWGVSRQRYWGAPIPVVNCTACGAVPVPDDQLPVILPTDVALQGVGSPIKDTPAFYETNCPQCEAPATRETDTFDTFMESSWYYARYASAKNTEAMLDEEADHWLQVDQYVGGIEHAILHLLYARFFHKLMRDAGLVSSDEPFKRLLTQGMVLKDGAKMSKSRGNTVDPQSLIDQYGADTVRLFSMFAAPPEQSLEWSDSGVEGAHRFIKRLWRLVHEFNGAAETPSEPQWTDAQKLLRRKTHETISKVTDDYGRRQTFNTAIAAVMELCNELSRHPRQDPLDRAAVSEGLHAVLKMLWPITPHLSESLWRNLTTTDFVESAWPVVDECALSREEFQVVVQVNGKVRGKIQVPATADNAEVEALAKANPNVQRFIQDATIKKVIVIPQKLVNIVAQ